MIGVRVCVQDGVYSRDSVAERLLTEVGRSINENIAIVILDQH
jgi:hypothetical protein